MPAGNGIRLVIAMYGESLLRRPSWVILDTITTTDPKARGRLMTDKDLQELLDQVRYVLRRNNYAYRTEETYLNWINRFVLERQILHA